MKRKTDGTPFHEVAIGRVVWALLVIAFILQYIYAFKYMPIIIHHELEPSEPTMFGILLVRSIGVLGFFGVYAAGLIHSISLLVNYVVRSIKKT